MPTSHTALVTGGTGGLGQAIARALRDQGHTVLVAHTLGNDHVPDWLKAQAGDGYAFHA
ncbi:MAG: KR domain-containing protein, partial [Castellaniella sp.]